MNRHELEDEIKDLKTKYSNMEKDLHRFGTELTAASQLAIILRMVGIQTDIEDCEKMLDLLKFDDIVRGEF